MQNILNLKLKLEELEKNNYSVAKQRLNQEEDKFLTLQHRKAGYEDDLREVMSKHLIISQIKRYEEAIETMKQLLVTQTQVVKKAQQAVDLSMAKLEYAMKERKMHEILREKAFDEYKKMFNQEEKKEIDELVSFQHSIKGER
jgi:flagellar FliJ protein